MTHSCSHTPSITYRGSYEPAWNPARDPLRFARVLTKASRILLPHVTTDRNEELDRGR